MPVDEVSDDEVEASRQRVDALSQQVQDAKNELALSETQRNNAARKAQTDQQAENLEAELQRLRQQLNTSQELSPTESLEPTVTPTTETGTTTESSTENPITDLPGVNPS